MSLDIWLEKEVTQIVNVVDMNITHNLTEMADEAGIYMHLWRPSEIGVVCGKDLIRPLEAAIKKMRDDPERFKKFDSPNGWGTYEDFLPWLVELIDGCRMYPDATVGVCT